MIREKVILKKNLQRSQVRGEPTLENAVPMKTQNVIEEDEDHKKQDYDEEDQEDKKEEEEPGNVVAGKQKKEMAKQIECPKARK